MKESKSLTIIPKELYFPPPHDRHVLVSMTLRNTAPRPVAFKIKTTSPQRYCVRPRAGVLIQDDSAEVWIILQPQSVHDDTASLSKDKFLVQAAFPGEDEGVDSRELWTEARIVVHQKLRCHYTPVPEPLRSVYDVRDDQGRTVVTYHAAGTAAGQRHRSEAPSAAESSDRMHESQLSVTFAADPVTGSSNGDTERVPSPSVSSSTTSLSSSSSSVTIAVTTAAAEPLVEVSDELTTTASAVGTGVSRVSVAGADGVAPSLNPANTEANEYVTVSDRVAEPPVAFVQESSPIVIPEPAAVSAASKESKESKESNEEKVAKEPIVSRVSAAAVEAAVSSAALMSAQPPSGVLPKMSAPEAVGVRRSSVASSTSSAAVAVGTSTSSAAATSASISKSTASSAATTSAAASNVSGSSGSTRSSSADPSEKARTTNPVGQVVTKGSAATSTTTASSSAGGFDFSDWSKAQFSIVHLILIILFTFVLARSF